MKTFMLLTLLLLLPQTLFANTEVTFSEYQADFRIKSMDHAHHRVRFSGETEVMGTLVIEFEMVSATQFGDPISTNFIPDADQVALLPEVVSGSYARKLERFFLINAKDLYPQLRDLNVSSQTGEFRVYGSLRIRNYGTSVECDSRNYFAEYVDFVPSTSVALINHKDIRGC